MLDDINEFIYRDSCIWMILCFTAFTLIMMIIIIFKFLNYYQYSKAKHGVPAYSQASVTGLL